MPDIELLDPALRDLIDQLGGAAAVSLQSLGVDGAREAHAMLSAGSDAVAVASVEDRSLAGVGCRVYVPVGAAATPPVLVWFHGGGWVLGGLDTADSTVRRLADRSGHLVVSVGYRLAPESPFPAACDDAWAVTEWLVDGGAAELGADPSRISVGGDSAGGNLAAVCALLARDAGRALRRQVLVYPVTDLSREAASYTENGEGFLLSADTMRWFIASYTSETQRSEWRASPLLAPDLAGLAPAYVLTAGFDPLRDEGDAYAERLRASGVQVVHDRVPGAIHAFVELSAVTPLAGQAVDRIGAALASWPPATPA